MLAAIVLKSINIIKNIENPQIAIMKLARLVWLIIASIFFTGKILTDETALSEYNIDEKKFIVVMVTKPKAPEKSDSGDGASTATSTT